MSKNILFIKPQIIKDRTNISDNIDDKMLVSSIKYVQDVYLEPALGTTFFKGLQDRIENGVLTDLENTLITDYIHDTLLYYVLSELPVASFKFYNKGVLQKTSENTNAPSMSELMQLSQKYMDKAEFYRNRLVNYLKANDTSFAEYYNYNTEDDDITPLGHGFATSIYLGDDDDQCDPASYLQKE